MKKVTNICLIIFSAISISAQQPAKNKPAEEAVQLKTPADSNQYILGAYLGQYINSNGFVISNADLFIRGMNDAMGNKTLLVSAETVSKKMSEYQNRLSVERNVQLEKQLFAEIKAKNGIGILPSGVCYSVIKTGTGRRPQPTDSVTLQIKGFLPDGKLFEDSYQKAPYKVVPSGLIPGMNEAVQIMPAGSTWRLYVPSSLAFAEKGLPGIIPPYSAVIYEVELIEVK